MVELLFVVWECLLCHDLEVEYEHDHHAILVLHWHHVHHTQEAVTCMGREEDGAQVGNVFRTVLSGCSFRTGSKFSSIGEVINEVGRIKRCMFVTVMTVQFDIIICAEANSAVSFSLRMYSVH